MKRIIGFLSIIAILAFVASCNKEERLPSGQFEKHIAQPVITISAAVEQDVETKTSLTDDLHVIWNDGDAISLLASSGVNLQFATTESQITEEGARASFNHEGAIDQRGYFALYPYNSTATTDGSVITTTLPSVQTAVAGTFGPGANLAVAYADWGETFSFMNAAAMVKVSFKTTDANAAIRKITIRSKDESILLSGKVTLTPTVENGAVTAVALAVTEGEPYASIEAPAGSYLTPSTAEETVEYYIAVAPVALTGGYVIEFETDEGLVFSKEYTGGDYNAVAFTRNKVSATGKKNFDNYELTGYFRVRYAETQNQMSTGTYLAVYKMGDGSYRIFNQAGTDSYILKGTHFELSGSNMLSNASYKRAQMEGMVAYVFRGAWSPNSPNSYANAIIPFCNDELILSDDSNIGLEVGSYVYGGTYSQKTYYYANIVVYNRTDNTTATVTLDDLAYSLDSNTDAGLFSGKFNTRTASQNPGGNANTCTDLVNALLKHATFSVLGMDMTSSVKSSAVSALKGDDNAFTIGFTTASHTSKNGVVSQNHFMLHTDDLLSGAQLSDIWLYKYDTKTYAYYISNK